MDPKIIAALVLLLVCCCSSSMAMMMSGGGDEGGDEPASLGPSTGPSASQRSEEEEEEEVPPRDRFEWEVEGGIDYPYNDLYHYHENSTPVGSKEACLDKCAEMENCQFVTFNNELTKCWGKSQKGDSDRKSVV